jgi:hypothetical protein
MKRFQEVTVYRVAPRGRPQRIFRDEDIATSYAKQDVPAAVVSPVPALRADDGSFWTVAPLVVETGLSADATTVLRALDRLSPKERRRVLQLAGR